MDNKLLTDQELIKSFISKFNIFEKKFQEVIGCFKNLNDTIWLDSADVCQILNISDRTLQYYRDAGKIGFSKIEGKYFYKSEDVKRFLHLSK